MSHQHGNGGMMPSMDNNATNMNMDTTMHMSFYWGKNATILFPDWPNHNLGMYILSLFFIFSLSFCIEAFSVLTTANLPRWTGSGPITGGLKLAAAYALRTALTYMVMISVMSFNVGIFMAAVIGHTMGFFVVKYRVMFFNVGIFMAAVIGHTVGFFVVKYRVLSTASATDITLKV